MERAVELFKCMDLIDFESEFFTKYMLSETASNENRGDTVVFEHEGIISLCVGVVGLLTSLNYRMWDFRASLPFTLVV